MKGYIQTHGLIPPNVEKDISKSQGLVIAALTTGVVTLIIEIILIYRVITDRSRLTHIEVAHNLHTANLQDTLYETKRLLGQQSTGLERQRHRSRPVILNIQQRTYSNSRVPHIQREAYLNSAGHTGIPEIHRSSDNSYRL